MTGRPLGRRPGGADTREQILVAAREVFAANGYDQGSLRAVARRANVDPALIHHYFGSKEGLLAESLAVPVDVADVLAGVADDPERAGAAITRRFLAIWDGDPGVRERYLALLRTGLSHDRAAAALREALSRSVLPVLQHIVADDTAPLRAALIGSHLTGLAIGRYVLRVAPLAAASHAELVALMGPALQHYVTGVPVPDGENRPG